MSKGIVELHPRYDAHIFLHRFKNIDLPYRGYYQVRVSCATEGECDVEVRQDGKERQDTDDGLFPASVEGKVAVSRTIEVIYADEEFSLGDGFFLHLQCTSVVVVKVMLEVELWYMERTQPPRNDRFSKLNSRKMVFSIEPSKSVNAVRSLYWDYATCASVTIGVTAAIVSLLPTRKRKENPDPPLSENLRQLHSMASSSLFGTITALQNFLKAARKFLSVEIVLDDALDAEESAAKSALISSDSPWKELESQAVHLSGKLMTLFAQTVDLCSRNERIVSDLLERFTQWRIRHLSAAFFSFDREHESFPSQPVLPLSSLQKVLGSHPYLSSLPLHPLSSPALDFAPSNMVFIFEETFVLAGAPSPPSPSTPPRAVEANGNPPHAEEAVESASASSATNTSTTSPLQIDHSPRALTSLGAFAVEKESIKEAVSACAGSECILKSECIRGGCEYRESRSGDVHLVVFVHGLEGARDDLWPYRVGMKRLLGDSAHFFCSRVNEGNTWGDVEALGVALLHELDAAVSVMKESATRVSFVAHSLGGVIVRAALAHPDAAWLRPRLHTLLTLNSPHLGLVYSKTTSHVGLTLVQWYKRSRCLSQLSLRDASSFEESFLVQLALKNTFSLFKNVLLLGSRGDVMVPRHSALAASCPVADKDRSSMGAAFRHMLHEVQHQLLQCTVVRYSVVHRKHGERIKGRSAHTACVEDSLFIEKLLATSAIKYFY